MGGWVCVSCVCLRSERDWLGRARLNRCSNPFEILKKEKTEKHFEVHAAPNPLRDKEQENNFEDHDLKYMLL